LEIKAVRQKLEVIFLKVMDISFRLTMKVMKSRKFMVFRPQKRINLKKSAQFAYHQPQIQVISFIFIHPS